MQMFPIKFPRRTPGRFGDHVPPTPMSAPTADMGFRAYWQAMDGASCFSDAGTTPCVADDPCYRLTESLGVVSNSWFQETTNRPIFKTGGAGGKSYLQFDGANSVMNSLAISNFFANNAKVMVMAFSVTSYTNGDYAMSDHASPYIMSTLVTGNVIKTSHWSGSYKSTTGVSFATETPFVYVFKHSDGYLYDAKNGIEWTAGVADGGNTTVLANTLTLACDVEKKPAINVYSLSCGNTVSDENLQLVINYLMSQLGIS